MYPEYQKSRKESSEELSAAMCMKGGGRRESSICNTVRWRDREENAGDARMTQIAGGTAMFPRTRSTSVGLLPNAMSSTIDCTGEIHRIYICFYPARKGIEKGK